MLSWCKGLWNGGRERERTYSPDMLHAFCQRAIFSHHWLSINCSSLQNSEREGESAGAGERERRIRERERVEEKKRGWILQEMAEEEERYGLSDPQNEEAFHHLTSPPRRAVCALVWVCVSQCTIDCRKRSPQLSNWFISVSGPGIHCSKLQEMQLQLSRIANMRVKHGKCSRLTSAMETPEGDDDDDGQSCGGSCAFLFGLLEAITTVVMVPSAHTFSRAYRWY